MTLTELLVSSVLIGIVMLGVVSVEYASKRAQENISRRSIATARVSSMMLHMAKNAALTVGDVTNIGIQTGGTGNSSYSCFRQDVPQTPDVYSDDTWVCYTLRTTNVLYTCNNQPSPTFCADTNTTIRTLGSATAFTVTYTPSSSTQDNKVTISLTSLYDSSSPYDASDPSKNPRVIMTAEVNPMGHTYF